MRYTPAPHLLAFIDALGFSKLVGRESSTIVSEYLNVIEAARTTWANLEGKRPIKFKVIGDSLILSTAVEGRFTDEGLLVVDDATEARYKFWNLCFGIAEIQFQLAKKNIWTRGAVTYDFLSVETDSDVIVGPAFHRAYNLEVSIAKFPRVVIDGGLVSAFRAQSAKEFVKLINRTSLEGNVLFDNIPGLIISTVTQDVPTFVDFLNSPMREQPSTLENVRTIAAHISKNLKTDLAHYAKYRWLADYVCKHINLRPELRTDPEFEKIAIFLEEG